MVTRFFTSLRTKRISLHTPESFSKQVRDCVQRMDESDVAGLSGLFDLTSQRLVRLAVTITRDQHDAEDAVQSVLVRVADHPGLLSRARQPWHFLLRMVRNEALLVLRRRKRCFVLADLSALQTQTSVDEVEREEEFQAVWEALRKLPVRQSEVVVLKIWEELTFAQIAELLEISVATAASRYRYGLGKLSQRLAGHGVSLRAYQSGGVSHE